QGYEAGPDDPQLGQEDGHRGDAGGDVDALGDPEEAGGPGRDREPAEWVLMEMGVQTGDETDAEENAERGAQDGGQTFVAQRAAIGVLVQGQVGIGGQVADASLERVTRRHVPAPTSPGTRTSGRRPTAPARP